MMYLLFNNDGSIKHKQICEFVDQGNNNVNKIAVAIEGRETSEYTLICYCKLSNGETVVISPSNPAETTTIEYNGEEYSAIVLTLTKDSTALAGNMKLNIQAIRLSDDVVLTTYSVYILVNEGVNPGEVVMMTAEQAQEFISIMDDAASKSGDNYFTGDNIFEGENDFLGQFECGTNDQSKNCTITFFHGSKLKSQDSIELLGDFDDDDPLKPNYAITEGNNHDLDTFLFNSGITAALYNVLTEEFDTVYKYSFPAKSGTFAMTSDVSPKADKVVSATNGHLAGLDSSGNLTDSGHTASELTSLDNRVDALETIGRFLSLWNASTGEAVSNPPTSPYAYKTGDYFRVSVGGTKIVTGSSYIIGSTNYTTSITTLGIGDVLYYDGTNWQIQTAGSGGQVVDVQVNGDSVVAAGIAEITINHLYLHKITVSINSNSTDDTVFYVYSHLSTFGYGTENNSYDKLKNLLYNAISMRTSGIANGIGKLFIVAYDDSQLSSNNTLSYYAGSSSGILSYVITGITGITDTISQKI